LIPTLATPADSWRGVTAEVPLSKAPYPHAGANVDGLNAENKFFLFSCIYLITLKGFKQWCLKSNEQIRKMLLTHIYISAIYKLKLTTNQ